MVIAAGWDAYQVLIVSQVALSIQLPFAVGPLVWLTARRQVMGPHANSRATTTLAVLVLVLLVALNLLLLRGLLTG